MAAKGKRSQSPTVTTPTIRVEDNGFVLDLDTAIVRDLIPYADATASGMLLANVQQKCSIICEDEKGPRPVNFSISVYVKRDAITDDEAFRVSAAKDASKADKLMKAKDAAEQHSRDIKSAEAKVKEMLREGSALAEQNLASSIKTVGAVIPVLQSLGNLAAASGLVGNKPAES